ncbi:MAG: dihydroorotase [Deltaproteobacteria bacterium]|nr:MAG: dihydroorotase [Deltaproteobacteria bacterium]
MILIKDGTVVDPVKERLEKLDIIIDKNRIKEITPSGKISESDQFELIIDAQKMIITPGLVDMHVHLREPGHEYKEDIRSGTLAAVAGGFTDVACMPNTDPVNDNASVTRFILEKAEEYGFCRVHPIAAITVGQKGERLTEFGELKKNGAVAVSDDGRSVLNSDLMRRALEYANYCGLAVISHCEDPFLSEGGVMHEGRISTQIGLSGIPSAAEEIMVARDILLAKLTNCPVHIAHVSTEGSVKLIKMAKEQGIPVTAETAPHYFSLDHTAVIGYDTNAKVNPPLRTEKDVEAIKNALKEDIIDVIATDHAPHSPLEKEVEFDRAEFGMIGLQTAVPLTLNLVREGSIDLIQAIKKLSVNPASILKISCGKIEIGEKANLTIIDPEFEYVLTEEMIFSKSKNTPFLGKKLKGIVKYTFVDGELRFALKLKP